MKHEAVKETAEPGLETRVAALEQIVAGDHAAMRYVLDTLEQHQLYPRKVEDNGEGKGEEEIGRNADDAGSARDEDREDVARASDTLATSGTETDPATPRW